MLKEVAFVIASVVFAARASRESGVRRGQKNGAVESERGDRLRQIRMDALTAVFLYSRGLRWLSLFSNSLTFASILTPISILVVLNSPIGAANREAFENVSYISSAVLLMLSIAALIFRIEVKKEAYIAGRASNIFIASEALKLLANPEQDVAWFVTYTSGQDTVDQNNLGNVDDGVRKAAYRESLKRLFPGDASVVCSFCGSSPHSFEKGDCQLCGNRSKETSYAK